MLPKFFSNLTIYWFSPVLRKGWRKPLEVGDLLPLPQHLVCESAYHAFLRGLSALPVPPSDVSTHGPRALICGDAGKKGVANTTHTAPSGELTAAGCGRNYDDDGKTQNQHHPELAPSPEQHLYDIRALLKLIWLLHGAALRRALLLIYGYQVFVFFQPVLLNELTNQLTHGRSGDQRIWILPALLFLSPLLGSLCKVQAQLTMIQIQIILRSQLTAAVYRKCLRLSTGSRASLPSGRVVNLMSADVAKICDFIYPQLTFISVAPLAVVVSLTMLWFQIGWATLVGLLVLLLSTPVSNIAVRATQRHRNEMLKAADNRMKLVGQFLAGVRVIKMCHWERPQATSITRCREEELRALRNMIPSKVAMQTLLYVLPQLAGVLSFLVVGLTQPQALTAGRAFSSLVLFQIMRFPLLTLSTGLVELGAAIISARRITSFMAAEEQRDYVTRLTQPHGTTPTVPPAKSRRGSFSTDDKCNGAEYFSVAAGQNGGSSSLHRHSEGSLFRSSVPHPPAHAESDGANIGAATGSAGAAVASGALTADGSSTLRRGSTTPLSRRSGPHGLMGVEPGLTMRAAGFRWAAVAAAQGHEEQQQQQLGKDDATTAMRGWRPLSLLRRDTPPRPFMEVVDAAGESLVASAAGLKAQLARVLTVRRNIGTAYLSSSCPASAGTVSTYPACDRSGFGDTALSPGAKAGGVPPHHQRGRQEDADDERVGLLRCGNEVRAPCPGKDLDPLGIKQLSGKAVVAANESSNLAPTESVVVACDSASFESDSSNGGAPCAGEYGGGDRGEVSVGGKALEEVKAEPTDASSQLGATSGPSESAGGFKLGHIDLRVRPGELVCVVGRVGSGKSSLLSAALGEMELVEELDLERGDVVGLGGRVAYAAQQAWVVNATFLENVTMGKPFDEAKWARCVEACSLGPDLELLPAGRDTEIGEKGLNLSGGQKQRLSLARAMYQEADIYLLDDPLSAVDVHVGAHIFTHMIRGPLAGAAVLLVTNAVQCLPAADSIVVLNAGEVVVQGTYKECLDEPIFRSLLNEFRSEQEEEQQQQQARGSEERTAGEYAVKVSHQHQLMLVAHLDRLPHQPVPTAAAGSNGGQDSYAHDHHQGLPSVSHKVSTLAYETRRASVELVQRQQELHVKSLTCHLADLDEGNEMIDSLMRMSGDGAECESGSRCSRDGFDGAKAPNAADRSRSKTDGDTLEEYRPLLSNLSNMGRAGCGSEAADVTANNNSSRSTGLSNNPGSSSSSGSSNSREAAVESGKGGRGSASLGATVSSVTPQPAVVSYTASEMVTSAPAAKKGRITVIEDRELGQVKWKVYGAYLRAFNSVATVGILLFWAAEQGTRLATNAWLARWSRSTQQQQHAGHSGSAGLGGFAEVYLLLAGAYAFATFCRSTTNNLGSYRASKILHARTLAALMEAPLVFFEATPVGRILNRLSRDVDEMDYNLAMYQQQLGNCVMRLIATIIFLCVLQPAFVGVVVPLTIIYFMLQKYFRRSSIELQRIDSVTRSPVYANFAETMSGLETIRAYRMQERFKERHEAMVDTNATAYYNARVADEWLSLRLDLIGSVIVFSIAALNVGLHSVTSVSPALVALALAEAIDLTSFLNYAVKVSAQVESRYNAVERLLTYAQLQPEESAAAGCRGPPHRPPGLLPWPATGELEFRDVWMSYRPGLDPVLQGVTFKVYDGQKVGVVGRTGSGKSSLVVALFRLVELQSGQMLLDGVDLRTLGLGVARTALSAIPQEPVLFYGSVRSNLDPWGHYSDNELWTALEIVALREHVRSIGGLSALVAEGGSNFSVGQRQLACVARALLRRPRVLIADEATASVDPETDAIIQRAVRTHFKSSTVLAIAHRLNTILDSDAVLLMNAGLVSEFGPVQELLARPGSAFALMAKEAGLLDAAVSS